MFSHQLSLVGQRLPCLHRLVFIVIVPCSSPRRHLQVAAPFTSVLLPLSPFDSLTFCANSSCSSMRDSGPRSGPGPAGDTVVTNYRIFSLVSCIFHPFSFVLDPPLSLSAVLLIHYPSDNEHRRSFRLRGRCSALETHSFPAFNLNTKRFAYDAVQHVAGRTLIFLPFCSLFPPSCSLLLVAYRCPYRPGIV